MTSNQSAMDVLTNLQVRWFQEDHSHKRGHITRRMNRLAEDISHLEWCLMVSPEALPSEMDR